MEKLTVDNGKSFDFGKTSDDYAKYRDIHPVELFKKLSALGVGRKVSNWLDLGTGVSPRAMAEGRANIFSTYEAKLARENVNLPRS